MEEITHPFIAKMLSLLNLTPQDLEQEGVIDDNLEEFLCSSLTKEDLEVLGIPLKVLPKILRPLPRFFHKDNRALAKVRGAYSHLPALKKQFIDRALLALYGEVPMPEDAKIILFTWVMPDGLGDYYTQKEAAIILKEKYPSLHIELVTLVHEKWKGKDRDDLFPIHYIYYCAHGRQDMPLLTFPQNIIDLLSKSDLILQIPTFYPHTQELLEQIKDYAKSMPKVELLGEFGLLERGWYHPENKGRCMGLHFLEKGIFIKKIEDCNFFDLMQLQNKQLLRLLFGKEILVADDIKAYRKEHRFNLDYTKSQRGAYIFLHALLKSLQNDAKNIDICFFHMEHFIENMQNALKSSDYSIFKKYGIGNVFICYKNFVSEIKIQNAGKTLRMIHVDLLEHADFLQLVRLTDDLFGCTGDGSIAEALSLGKVFFYDPPYHKRGFLKDLIALAKDRLSANTYCIEVLELCLPPANPLLEDQIGNWVGEDFFSPEETRSQEVTAEKLGDLLQDPTLAAGFFELSRIIKEEYSLSDALCQLVARGIIHKNYPSIEEKEIQLLNDFGSGQKNAIETLREVREMVSDLLPHPLHRQDSHHKRQR